MTDRLRTRISQDWKFFKGNAEGAEARGFDDSAWRSVDVPHDYSIEDPPSDSNIMWGGYRTKERGWYRKHLPPATDDGRRVYLEFEGVFHNSTIWVNGEKAGAHPWGYTGFVLDITPYLRRDGGPEVVAVFLDKTNWHVTENPEAEGWWYEGCGIYRHVWLISTHPVHVDRWGTFVTTPEVSESSALVNVKTTLRNDTEADARVTLETALAGPDGELLATLRSERCVPASGTVDIPQQARIEQPRLWSPDSPSLYTARTRVMVDGEAVDTYETPFGIRWFEFTPERGFFLNGKHIQLRGMCNHADCGGLGTALPDRVNEKTVEIMKGMGCNLLRSAHHDAAPSLMESCDRLGMLVWAETRYLDAPEVAGAPLRDLIQRNRNHPSIICWSLANTAGSPDGKLTGYLKALNEIAHAEDPTRPTAFGCEANTDANANGFAFVTDIMGYNGGGMGIDDRDHHLFPERKMLVSEFSSGRGARGIYENIPSGIETKVTLGDGRVLDFDGRYCSIYDLCRWFEKEWTHIDERPWLAGGAMWSGFEYYGETSGWPTVTSQFGVLDICRFPKDTYYYFIQEWTDKPMVHVFPHWTWPGREGQEIEVWGYTTCDSVRLSLNGQRLGEKPRGRLTHMEWKVPYQPGVLLAEGVVDGRVVCVQEIRTAGDAAKLRLSADRFSIRADAQDVSFVTISVHDAQGNTVPTAACDVRVEVAGAGKLIGLASGDPRSHENPKDTRARTFSGLLLAIVQSTGEPGAITVAASSEGLAGASVELAAASV